MRRFYTYQHEAKAAKRAGQVIRFTSGKGYYLFPQLPAKITPFTMYDSVTVGEIPSNAVAVAGYVNGYYATMPKLATAFPHAKQLSVAVNVGADARCLDVERGDATPDQAPAWVKRQHARGITQPVVYTFLAQAQTLVSTLDAAGIHRSQYKLWIAHWTYQPHICTPKCGYGLRVNADATQWSNKALGRNLDASKCSPGFL